MTHDPLIIALDVNSVAQADAIVDSLGSSAGFYKVGIELFTVAGMDYVRCLLDRGKRVFLDLKFYDIHETVRRAVAMVAAAKPDFLTVHAVPQVMRAAVEGRGDAPLKLLGVTVLTSFDQSDIDAMGHTCRMADLIAQRARQAKECGLDAIVCSPVDVAAVRAVVGPELLLVTPGVRSAGAETGDQKRVATPSAAIANGANYLVIGRQVTRAADPRAAVEAIREELLSECLRPV